MTNKSIFCNVPWSNVHIYWDGTFGICCSEKQKPYNENNKEFSLEHYTIPDWFNTLPIREFRTNILSDKQLPACAACYFEESHGYESRRIKENFKSVIFTELAFDKSYEQSPWNKKFEFSKISGHTDLIPIDWHVDFGNECNLACKMCNPNASSMIASIMRQHNRTDVVPKVSWTNNPKSWDNFLKSVDQTDIKRIHVMGGEPSIMKKYHEFVDYLIANDRTNLSLSFVSNGTVLNQELIDKLLKFSNVDIEISIEAVDRANNYIRLGSEIDVLLKNIETIKSYQGEKLQLIMRTVPQLLSISRYAKLVRFAWDNKFIIEGIPLTRPRFMRIDVLPKEYRQTLIEDLEILQKEISKEITMNTIQNGRSLGTLPEKLSRECLAIISMLKHDDPENVEELRKQFVAHNSFWDKQYKLKTEDYIPEIAHFIKEWTDV